MALRAVGFGYKMAWLAVKDSGGLMVAEVLGLGKPQQSDWSQAVATAYAGGWLLTPQIEGWTLAASVTLAGAADDPEFVDKIADLSRLLRQVQFFCTDRVVEMQAWASATNGIAERAYGYLGERDEVLFDIGSITPDERQLHAEDMADYKPDEWSDESPVWRPNEETVLTLAGMWSVDPRDLEAAEVDSRPLVVLP